MAQAKTRKLPQTLYVRWEDPGRGEEPFLREGESVEDLMDAPPDTQTIGVYELQKLIVAKSTVSVSSGEKT